MTRRVAQRLPLAALVAALIAGCNSQSEATAAAPKGATSATSGTAASAPAAAFPTKPDQLSAVQRSEIMRAAGFQLVKGKWTAPCDPGYPADGKYEGAIEELRDLNKDGMPEAVLGGDSYECFGNNSHVYKVLIRGAAGWRVLTDGQGFPGFYPRAGIVWPDIEVGGPGAYCFAFDRWNGSKYEFAGYSIEGKICETFKPSKIAGLTTGYYTPDGNTEGVNASYLYFVAVDRIVSQIGGRFVSLRAAGPRRFIQTNFFPSEEDDGSGTKSEDVIVVGQDGSFTLEGNTYYRVQKDRLQADMRFLELPENRDHPWFKGVRGQ